MTTVEPPNKEHNRNDLSIKDTSLGPKCSLSHNYRVNTFVTGYTKTGLIAQNKILRNQQKFITYKKWLLNRRSRLNRLLLDDASWYVNKTW